MQVLINPQRFVINNFIKKSDDADKLTNETALFSELPSYSNNKYLVSFKGLNKQFSKRAYKDAKEVKEQMDKYPASMSIVGNLPNEWIDKIPKAKRKEAIKEIYKVFNEAIVALRDNNRAKMAADKLTKVLQTSGILVSEKLHLKYLDKGSYGTAYLLEGFGEKYVIKVFQSNKDIHNIHGNFAEIPAAAYWQKNAGLNTHRVRFFFGDLDAGYMVNKYIDSNTLECKKKVSENLYGIRAGDEDPDSKGHNRISGYSVDYGGLIVDSPILMSNKTARFVYKQLYKSGNARIVADWHKFFEGKKYKNNSDIKVGLACSLRLLPFIEREKCFKKLAENADSKVKQALVYNLDIISSNSRKIGWYKKLAENADNIVKVGLLHQFNILSWDEKASFFEKFTENADNTVKVELLNWLNCLPAEKRASLFEKFAENADNVVKVAMADNLNYLPADYQLEWFEKLALKSDIKVKCSLVKQLRHLPESEKLLWFEKFAENADNNLKRALIPNLGLIPKTSRVYWFKKLAENSDSHMKKKLGTQLYYIPEEGVAECFNCIAKNASYDVKKLLATYLWLLPENNSSKLFKFSMFMDKAKQFCLDLSYS